uniref:glucan endo-1,3-beta-glucosidase 7-like isoform X2 n=1 Tax=Fragaria vesca subsp. vesca TaxID=101020 RepID=UPI0005CA3BF1|nr:PREDICTED: glucan endo-1,3-beta-glucosidase 7-like isoform X2 [Fragaria vesca subsp. vesca]
MAKAESSFSILILFLLQVQFFYKGQAEASTVEWVKTWCIAKPSTSKEALQNNLEYACSNINAMDCTAIQEGGPCSEPNDLLLYASFAMNAYYQAKGRHYWNCDFSNSGLISLTDPSYGSCTYEGGETAVDDSNSGKWCVASPSASDDQIQANIDFACDKVDCSIISSGGACYEPNTVKNRASVAMNLYYQQTGQADTSCDFNGSGNIIRTDPSYGDCKFKYS